MTLQPKPVPRSNISADREREIRDLVLEEESGLTNYSARQLLSEIDLLRNRLSAWKEYLHEVHNIDYDLEINPPT